MWWIRRNGTKLQKHTLIGKWIRSYTDAMQLLMQLVDIWDIDFAGSSHVNIPKYTMQPFDYNDVLQQNMCILRSN